MKTETIHTVTNRHTIYYRFTCEHCGFTTAWFPVEIERSSEKSSGYHKTWITADQKMEISSKAAESVQKRIDTIRNEVSCNIYPVEYTPQEGEGSTKGTLPGGEKVFATYICPNCKVVQSWGMNSFKKQNHWKTLFGIIGAILPIVMMLLLPKETIGFGIFLLIWIAAITAGVIIGALCDRKRNQKIEKKVSMVSRRNLPEINWNGR